MNELNEYSKWETLMTIFPEWKKKCSKCSNNSCSTIKRFEKGYFKALNPIIRYSIVECNQCKQKHFFMRVYK